MSQNKTFQNLMVLESARDTAKEFLQDKYLETVKPFVTIIEMTMKANSENHFEAAKRIQDQTKLIDTDQKKTLFAAALMELVEYNNLKSLK